MFPVTRTASATNMAGLARIGWVYQNERNTSLKGLIAQELSELIEGPTVNPSALVLPNFLVNILSDARKIFQSYLGRDLLSSGYNGFADFMVNLSLISALLSRQPFLKLSTSSSRTSSAFGSFLLENRSHRSIMVLDPLNGLAAKLLAFRSYGDVSNSKIDAKNLIGLDRLRCFALGLDVDVILRAFFAERCTCGPRTSEPVSLEVSENQLNSLSGSEKGKTDRFILLSECKDPSIIVDAGRLKALDGRVVFQSGLTVGSNTVDCSDGKIGRETELRPDVPVNHVVNYHAVSKVLRHVLIDPVTSICERLQGILHLRYLLRRWGQLAYCSQNKFSHLRGSHI